MIVYNSTDSGAPVIANANNSLNGLLYACLVTGYGAKAGAGWTRPFTGTNLAAYRQGAGGNGRYLRVFDGGLQADAQFRRVSVRGYEAMTAISTGTGPFPTTGQMGSNGANYPYWNINSTLAPKWTMYASSSFFILIIDTFDLSRYYEMMAFGSFFSMKSGDTYNDVLMASQSGQGGWPGYMGSPGPTTANSSGIWVARNDIGTAGAKEAHLVSSVNFLTAIGQGSSASFPYPERTTNALLQSQPVVWVDGYRRGRIPGLWESVHAPGDLGGDGTTWSGATGALSGKTFRLVSLLSPSYIGAASPLIETSDTWS